MKLLFNLFWGATIFRWAYASSDESFTICLRFKIDHFPNQGSENHEVVTLENRDEGVLQSKDKFLAWMSYSLGWQHVPKVV